MTKDDTVIAKVMIVGNLINRPKLSHAPTFHKSLIRHTYQYLEFKR